MRTALLLIRPQWLERLFCVIVSRKWLSLNSLSQIKSWLTRQEQLCEHLHKDTEQPASTSWPTCSLKFVTQSSKLPSPRAQTQEKSSVSPPRPCADDSIAFLSFQLLNPHSRTNIRHHVSNKATHLARDHSPPAAKSRSLSPPTKFCSTEIGVARRSSEI